MEKLTYNCLLIKIIEWRQHLQRDIEELESEVRKAINQLSKRKAPGKNEVPVELLKAARRDSKY